MRLDELLVSRGLFSNTHDAQAAVMAGEVIVGDHRADSCGMKVRQDASVRLKANKRKGGFVSRGGLKLLEALRAFSIDVAGCSCVDLGASSGGFTDCLLQQGAAHVSAVDVNAGQFDWGLRNDPRVSLFERTNIRTVDAHDIGGPFDVAVADLSFISLRTVMGDIATFLKPGGVLVSLVKPQFEGRRDEVEEGGVVRDAAVHVRCIESVLSSAVECGFEVCAITHSPITGPAGNIEFLFWGKFWGSLPVREGSIGHVDIERVVRRAHDELGAGS